jgi:hypothetical protein
VLEEGGRLRRVAVETGIRDDAFVEVSGPLEPGAEVALGYERRREGNSWRGPRP